jgi:hypothetical protein
MLEHTFADFPSVEEHVAREHQRARANKRDAFALLGLVLALSIFFLIAGLRLLSA